MKKGQKITKNGYQMIGFPMAVMNITQGNNVGTHLGTNALDNAGRDTGIEETYAPFDMRFVAYDTAANGNAVWFESLNKVLFRDGTIDYATIMALHDNYIGDIIAYANQGKTWAQGQSFGDEGTAGLATGNHIHFEIAKGKFTKCYARNAQGVWHLPNNVSADLACVTDGTTIINKGTFANWADSAAVGAPSGGNISKPSTALPDQILTPNSIVTSVPMSIAIPKGATTAIKTINGCECVYIPAIGGYFPMSMISEADASDGKKDNYLANTNAKVIVGKVKVTAVDVKNNLVMLDGTSFWVNPTPLTELQNGN